MMDNEPSKEMDHTLQETLVHNPIYLVKPRSRGYFQSPFLRLLPFVSGRRFEIKEPRKPSSPKSSLINLDATRWCRRQRLLPWGDTTTLIFTFTA